MTPYDAYNKIIIRRSPVAVFRIGDEIEVCGADTEAAKLMERDYPGSFVGVFRASKLLTFNEFQKEVS